jgi:UDP-N-acetylglucosamine 4,6-dehydratase
MKQVSLEKVYKGKRILVTGGTGSIGSGLVKKLLTYRPEVVRVFSNDENAQFEMEQELKDYSACLWFLVGYFRDKERLQRATQNIEMVFHAAALKHVPLCEYNPFEAIKTNVIGTQNLLEVAIDENVEKVITISTDKAANPLNVYGATKLLAERLTIAANYYRGLKKTVFSCVRFGNVLASRGSVVQTFDKQIRNCGPVTLTDPEMVRFFMSMDRAVYLVLKAAQMAQGEEIFILKMPALRITDLAEVMIRKIAPSCGYKPEDVKTSLIGKRKGEKIYEELMTEEEAFNAYDNEEMLLLLPQTPQAVKSSQKGFKKITLKRYTSKDTRMLTKKQIEEMLESMGK